MSTYNILFLGDVVGRPGRSAIRRDMPVLADRYRALFTIVNGENAAGGVGITPDIADEIFAGGADAITLGNHAFNKREISDYLDTQRPIVRPANMPKGVPGDRTENHLQRGRTVGGDECLRQGVHGEL